MKFEAFNSLVKELKGKRPVWFGLESDPRASEADIAAAESSLQVALPPEYSLFVKEFGGGYFAFANVFSVNANSEWNIVRRNDGRIHPDFVAFSDNGTGDYYGFRIDEGKCTDQVYFWDHEEPSKISPTEFEDLLDYLKNAALRQT